MRFLVDELLRMVPTPPACTCPAAVTILPVMEDVQDQSVAERPAGTAYSESAQLAMSSHTGVTGFMCGVEAGTVQTSASKKTSRGSGLWFISSTMPIHLP